MDFQLSEEQRMLVRTLRDVGREVFAPKAAHWDAIEEAPREHIPLLAELGVLGMVVGESYGGPGRPPLEAILAIEEITKACPNTGAIVFESNVGPVQTIMEYGTEEQKRRYLPGVVSGAAAVSVAMTEPEAGSALTDLQTSAVLDGDQWVINGTKRFVSGAGESTAYVVYVRFDGVPGGAGIGGLIIEADAPGLTIGSPEKKLGMRGHPQADLVFDDCRVPKGNLLVPKGEMRKLMSAFNLERCGNATMSLAIAQAAFDFALEYVQTRRQFGREICEFQGVQFMLADMSMQLDAARLLIQRAVTNAQHGFPSIREASTAKCFSNEMAIAVTNTALQLFGGYGHSRDYPVERLYRDARGWAIAGGTTQIQRIMIASQLLGRKLPQRVPSAN